MQCYILTYFRLMTGSIGDFRCNQRRQITIMRIVNETQTQVIAFHISPVNTVQQGGQMENHQSTQCNRVVRQKITSQHSATGWSDGKSPVNKVQQGGQTENHQPTQCNRVVRWKINKQGSESALNSCHTNIMKTSAVHSNSHLACK